MASQITSLTNVYSNIYSGVDQGIHQSSASLAFVRGFHRWPVNSPHKGPVTRNTFPSLCTGNLPLTGEFSAQRASNAENVSIGWHHHGETTGRASDVFLWRANWHEIPLQQLLSPRGGRCKKFVVSVQHIGDMWRCFASIKSNWNRSRSD